MTGKTTMRLCGIDILRGLAAFGIVGCHLMLTPRTAAGGWVTHFCDMNVAVFGVIAGYFTHISDGGGTGADIAKRLRRLLPTYVVWTLVFLAASLVFKIAAHDDLSQYAEASFWANAAFFGGSSAHLWFIAVLVYAQVFALSLLERNPPAWIRWGLGIAGIALSVALDNWWGTYFFRLFGFLWLGIALRGIRGGSWKVFGIATLVALVAHVMLTGLVYGFVRDLLVAVPLVLFAARLPLGGGGGGGGYIPLCAIPGRDKHVCLPGASASDEVRLCRRHTLLRQALWGRGRPDGLASVLGVRACVCIPRHAYSVLAANRKISRRKRMK